MGMAQLLRSKAVTVSRIAREWNQGLEAARASVAEHNRKIAEEFTSAGMPKYSIKKALLQTPQPCPTKFNRKWIQKFLHAFDWRHSSRNTSGNYLDHWLQSNIIKHFGFQVQCKRTSRDKANEAKDILHMEGNQRTQRYILTLPTKFLGVIRTFSIHRQGVE